MDESSRIEIITFEKQAFHLAAHVTNSNIAANWLSTPNFMKRTDFWRLTERN